MATRKSIEKGIAKEISIKVSSLDFKIIDKSLNVFEHIEGNVKWEFWFSLTNKNIYSLFCKASVTYLDLTQTINTLLVDTPASNRFSEGVEIIEDELRIIQEKNSLKLSDINEVKHFTNEFYKRIEEIKEKFWIPQSSAEQQIESFKTKPPGHWLNSSLIQNVAICVAKGIINDDGELIKFALIKGEESLSDRSQSYDEDKLLIHTLRSKLLKQTDFMQ